ncbi:hypothetical protein ACQRBH_12065 [Bariatricus sp. SGI.161]|uniref:hypothetical protein n=1 Tax=Bariatricus sp. SGI.161 TaxID=3420550 RepID=UPI003CFE3C06
MKSILYDKSEAVAALNRVEGFNPVELARRLEKEGQEDQLYLDVKYRKLWFRLVYPMGKIISIVRSFSENAALVEARIYLDKCDAEDNFIANAFSQKFRSEDPNFGAKFLELAETAAVGRALSDAGFGLQFADVGEENDLEQVDAGIQITQSSQNSGTVQSPYSGNRADYQSTENTYQQTERQMTGGSIPPMQTQSGMMGQFFQQAQANGSIIGQPSMQNTYGQQPGMNSMAVGTAENAIDGSLPVEELLQHMTYEQAVQVVIPGKGKYGGKTMGQVAKESPQSLEWFARSYSGNNNAVSAAAKFLLNKALPMAG